jgi:LCP family protein required for cell wall assembly
MSSQGDERPPERPEDSDAPEPDVPEPDTPVPDAPKGDDPAEYTVYGKDGEERRQDAPEREDEPEPEAKPEPEAEPEAEAAGKPDAAVESPDRPDYKVYRSRPSLRDRLRKPDLAGLSKKESGGGLRDRLLGGGGDGKRRWLRWVLIGVFGWILLSFIAFAVSAQIQKSELSDETKQALAGGPDVLAGSNILILGGDQRTGKTGRNEPGTEGSGPPRADTIMVLHASLTSFRKLSIPRDTLAEIPGFGAEKINAAFSLTGKRNGDAALVIETVQDFLGIDINHIVIVDFEGFADFIDTLGGIEVDLPNKVCGDISGGKSQGGVSLKLPPGEHTLESQKALALARLRKNDCDPSEDDLDRAARQQLILNGIKGRLTDPLRLPYNFVKGPLIGWNAPKAFISDMGGLTLPQVAIAAIFGGNDETNVLKPSGAGPGGSLFISQGECRRAVEKLTGSEPDREPVCSP